MKTLTPRTSTCHVQTAPVPTPQLLAQRIRLLRIYPRPEQDDNVLRGELIHTPLEDSTFAALSYAWEDPTLYNYPPPSQCTLHFPSGDVLILGSNLTAILSTVRESGAAGLYWIDAMCINQADVMSSILRLRECVKSTQPLRALLYGWARKKMRAT
jgi:hypothetical protein